MARRTKRSPNSGEPVTSVHDPNAQYHPVVVSGGAGSSVHPSHASLPLAALKEAPPLPKPAGPEPDEHLVYAYVAGGEVFAALHDNTPENHAAVLDAEELYRREGRHYRKVRVKTDHIPRHAQGGHDIGRMRVSATGELEVVSR